MKTSTVVLVSALAGSLAGGMVSWANFGNPPKFSLDDTQRLTSTASAKVPLANVDDANHDFGPIARDIKVTHRFKITNTGDAVLSLKAGPTTCSQCTISTIAEPSVAPGKSTEVSVQYSPSREQPHFRQSATVLTNDPKHPRLELNIFGRVVSDYDFIPRVAQFNNVPITASKTVTLRLTAGIHDAVKVVGYEFEVADTAPYFEINIERLKPEELSLHDNEEDGYSIAVTIKPGLPLGPIRQRIRFELAIAGRDKNPTYEVGVQGSIASDVSIAAPGWQEEHHLLRLGDVNGAEGANKELFVLVRGAERQDVVVTPISISPAWLKVSVGEAEELTTGTVRRIPVTIEIPPGTRSADFLGTAQAEYGKIVLGTTHSQAKQITLYLQLRVE